MKVELTKGELGLINSILQTVEVNKIPVNLQELLQTLHKLNTPVQESEDKTEDI